MPKPAHSFDHTCSAHACHNNNIINNNNNKKWQHYAWGIAPL
jgi:hypothetical protein